MGNGMLRMLELHTEQVLSEEFVESLREFLSERERTYIEVHQTNNAFSETLELWAGDGETDLLIRVFNRERLIIKSVILKNRRVGTFTEAVQMLSKQVMAFGISTLEVESVLTSEMRDWCLKNGLELVPALGCLEDGLGATYRGSILN